MRERLIKTLFQVFAYVSILTTVGIVVVLLVDTLGFFRQVSLVEYLTDTEWRPGESDSARFGILPLMWGTLQATIIASMVALPIGLLAAIYLSEYAPTRVRRWLKPALEVLAGVPTVVFGFFAFTLVTPLLEATIFPDIDTLNTLSAGLVMGVMIIPTVASVSEDSIYAVPRALREGAYALGATKREVATQVVIPAALSGIMAAFILGISRAIGETMIVTVAAGASPDLALSPLEGHQAMTAYIAQVAGGETQRGTITYSSIFAVGFTLFLMTLLLNIASNLFVRRFRETYE
jgi:phosphate transport system permease protein